MPSHKPRRFATHENLNRIWKESRETKAAGIDKITPKKFKENLSNNLADISKRLITGNYKFSELRLYTRPKANGKYRIICIPTVRDRLVQRLILDSLVNPNDKLKIKNKISYGSIVGGGGVQDAICKALETRNKYAWVLKTDITSFFDNIDRVDLIRLLQKRLGRSSLLPLLEQVIKCEVRISKDSDKKVLQDNGIVRGKGLRQGMPLSPLLSNVILRSFDNKMSKKTPNIIRYVDDIIIFCDSREECDDLYKIVEAELKVIKHKIPSLSEINSKTEIKKPDEAVIFLGMEIYKSKNGKYLAKIPQEHIDDVMFELDKYSDYKHALSEELNYTTLMRKLQNKQNGYKAGFKEAQNFDTFVSLVEHKIEKIKNNLLECILGKDLLGSLSQDKKCFLGL